MKIDRRLAMAIAGPSAAIVLLALPVLLTGDRTGGYDWDWFFAHYEALRRSIVLHHQFPWWNPWSAGGAPLYADPQVGLVSLQTPLVLLFGTAMGLKLGYLVHLLLGFWGMYLLLGQFGAGYWRRVLLAGAWIGSTFVHFHFQAGHYTFLQYLLVPFVFHAVLRGLEDRRWRVGGAVAVAVLLHAAPHNVAIQALLLLALVLAHRLWRSPDRRRFLLDQGWAAGLVVLLCLPRIAFALEYLRDFPRTALAQPVGRAVRIAGAFLLPGQRMDEWGGRIPAWEQSAYLGLGLVALALGLLVRSLRRRDEPTFLRLFALAMVALVIGVGPVVSFSPYALLSRLPVLDTMQIPSRWFGWTLFLGALALGSVRRWPRWGNVLLAASVLELHASNLLAPTPFSGAAPPEQARPFSQYEDFLAEPGTQPPTARSAMYLAMRSNHGEVHAYEPMLGYDTRRPTRRCGINKNCGLVTGNGRISRWSPNELVVERQGPGPIFLNVNPGRYWLVDGHRYPGNPRVTEPTWSFAVDGPGPFVLKVRPANWWLLFIPLLSLPWLLLWRFRRL